MRTLCFVLSIKIVWFVVVVVVVVVFCVYFFFFKKIKSREFAAAGEA